MAALDPSTGTGTAAYIAVAVLTCVTTILVALIGRRMSPKFRLKTAAYYNGYDKWAEYMEKELSKAHSKIDELQEEVEKFKEKLYQEKQASQRMRGKLLWFSRKYNVDVSDVV